MRRYVVPAALFAAIALASLGPIHNYDLFWHLATGRWIAEHRALPAADPFAVASDRTPWINGEWLFEVVLHGLEQWTKLAGLSWIRALFIGALFTIVYWLARRDGDADNALLTTGLAFAGAAATVDLRPASVAGLFVALAIAIARRGNIFLYALVTVLWVNVHPSALLAPLIALCLRPRSWLPVIGAGALLVNPYGYHAIVAPIRLTLFARSGAFVNAEWLPSDPRFFPLLYVSLAVAAIVCITAHDRREHLGRVALALLFGYLAVRHVRNQPLWFAAFPLLVTPAMRTLRYTRALAYATAVAFIAWVAIRKDHRLGVSPSQFPLMAVHRIQSAGLRGNIYNPDQFGGFLIWMFYPERRVLTDGRNELYHAFIPEYAKARGDQRAWRALLAKYKIDLAVDEYRAPLDVIDGVTGAKSKMPASLAYWPRKDWALIGFDLAGMAFARRAAYPREVIEKWEIRGEAPDATR